MGFVNRGPQVSGVAGFFLAITWVTVALRCYCRAIVVKSFGVDDYLAVLSQVGPPLRGIPPPQLNKTDDKIATLHFLLRFCYYGGSLRHGATCGQHQTGRSSTRSEGMIKI